MSARTGGLAGLPHSSEQDSKCYHKAAVTVGRLRPTENGRVSYWEFQYYRPDFRDGTVLDNGIICPGSEYITHWMPLPEPPKEDAWKD